MYMDLDYGMCASASGRRTASCVCVDAPFIGEVCGMIWTQHRYRHGVVDSSPKELTASIYDTVSMYITSNIDTAS